MADPVEGHAGRRFTAADYFSWTDDGRWELLQGVPVAMVPAPGLEHQRVVLALGESFQRALRDRAGGGGPPGCKVFVAPVDVLLFPDTVVQPDVAVVCDAAKLANGRYVDGAPDLVAEVLSASTVVRDRREKRFLYERAGVTEYLLFDPEGHCAEHFELGDDGRYGVSRVLGPEDTLNSRVLGDLGPSLGALLDWAPPGVGEARLPYAG